MKRKNNLYQEICKIENIISAFEEVCQNTNNKKKVQNYKQYKSIYISRIYNVLNNKSYKVGKYNVFTIYEPKERRIVSQNLQDKVINHLVARYILYPAIMPCLIEQNVASRKCKGTRKGLEKLIKILSDTKETNQQITIDNVNDNKAKLHLNIVLVNCIGRTH